MVKVHIKRQSNFAIDTKNLKKFLQDFFERKGVVSDANVSVVFVGEKKMLEIGKKYLNDRNLHNVLSFAEGEVKKNFVYPEGSRLYLGEIIVCYPLARREANEENKLIDEKTRELLEHGALHLLGIHHE